MPSLAQKVCLAVRLLTSEKQTARAVEVLPAEELLAAHSPTRAPISAAADLQDGHWCLIEAASMERRVQLRADVDTVMGQKAENFFPDSDQYQRFRAENQAVTVEKLTKITEYLDALPLPVTTPANFRLSASFLPPDIRLLLGRMFECPSGFRGKSPIGPGSQAVRRFVGLAVMLMSTLADSSEADSSEADQTWVSSLSSLLFHWAVTRLSHLQHKDDSDDQHWYDPECQNTLPGPNRDDREWVDLKTKPCLLGLHMRQRFREYNNWPGRGRARAARVILSLGNEESVRINLDRARGFFTEKEQVLRLQGLDAENKVKWTWTLCRRPSYIQVVLGPQDRNPLLALRNLEYDANLQAYYRMEVGVTCDGFSSNFRWATGNLLWSKTRRWWEGRHGEFTDRKSVVV